MLTEVSKASPETLQWMGGKSVSVFLGSLVGLLGIGLGYPGQPHVITRYMAAKNTEAIQKGTFIALGWGLMVYSSSILLGICGQALFPGLEDPEHLFPKAAEQLLPTLLTAVVLTVLNFPKIGFAFVIYPTSVGSLSWFTKYLICQNSK